MSTWRQTPAAPQAVKLDEAPAQQRFGDSAAAKGAPDTQQADIPEGGVLVGLRLADEGTGKPRAIEGQPPELRLKASGAVTWL